MAKYDDEPGFSFAKLAGADNYKKWAREMRYSLESAGLWDYTLSTAENPKPLPINLKSNDLNRFLIDEWIIDVQKIRVDLNLYILRVKVEVPTLFLLVCKQDFSLILFCSLDTTSLMLIKMYIIKHELLVELVNQSTSSITSCVNNSQQTVYWYDLVRTLLSLELTSKSHSS